MNEIEELKFLLKELSIKDPELMKEAWTECINQGYLECFPKICQESYVSKLNPNDYKNYISDKNENIEDRYAKYFRLLFEYTNLDFEEGSKNEVAKFLYKKLLLETISKYGLIKCIEDKRINLNDRIYIFINQYLHKSNHAPSVVLEKVFENLTKYVKEIYIISTTPYPFPYPDKNLMYHRYTGMDENIIHKVDNNIHYIEFRGYLSESLYFDFLSHQKLAENDKFILVGGPSLHFDIIESNRKIVLPTSVSNLDFNTANYLCWGSELNKCNIFNKRFTIISCPYDFTRDAKLTFKPKKMKKNEIINIAIVGNRLDLELDTLFFKLMSEIADKVPNISFKIVGKINNVELFPPSLLPYIDFVGFISDLEKYFFDNIHFFLNPNRLGGAQSSVIAYKVGIPIITLPFGDVYEALYKKYSVEKYQQIPTFIEKYILNSEFKNQIDNLNKELVNQSIEQFRSFIEEIVSI